MFSSPALLSKILFLLPLLATPTLAFGKRGLAANDDIPIWQFGGFWEGRPSQVNWQYNWDSTTSNVQSAFAEYVPMLWGTSPIHTTNWVSNVNYWLNAGGSGHLLGFDEPELAEQANISPSDAAVAYRQHITPFSSRASLGSPAVSNDGLAWMQEFLAECADCGIEFLAVHWYNNWDQFYDLQNWINDICAIGNGRPVWLTEFEGYGNVSSQSAFLSQAIPWLDANDCVHRYAYLGVADPDQSLLENGALSALGVQYTFAPF